MSARAVELLCWWAALSLVWLGTLSTGSPVELVVGVSGGAVGAVAAVVARAALGASWRPSARWARWAARLPAALLTDSVRVLFGRSRATTREVAVTDPAVAGALLNTTPSTVVVDAHDDVLVLHAVGGRRSGLEREIAR